MYRIDLRDTHCKSMAASSCDGLKSNVAEYYGLRDDALEYRESDDGDMLALVGGANLGFVRRVK